MSERFIINGDGTVTDTKMGLMWQQEPKKQLMSWRDASGYCERLSLGGYGWRMPDIKELQSIVDYSRCEPAINIAIFGGITESGYWSSTEYVDNNDYAWYLHFCYGNVYNNHKSYLYYVLAVRTIQKDEVKP